jgi:hypothetical protein
MPNNSYEHETDEVLRTRANQIPKGPFREEDNLLLAELQRRRDKNNNNNKEIQQHIKDDTKDIKSMTRIMLFCTVIILIISVFQCSKELFIPSQHTKTMKETSNP